VRLPSLRLCPLRSCLMKHQHSTHTVAALIVSVSRAIDGPHCDSFWVFACYSGSTSEALSSVRNLLLERVADLPFHVLPASASYLESICRSRAQPYKVLMTSASHRRPLALVSPAKVFIWAMSSSNQRQINRPSPPSPAPLHSATVLFLDTAATGNTMDILKQALPLQTSLPFSRDEPLTFYASATHRAAFWSPWPVLKALGAMTVWTASSSPSRTYHSR
jgi:hypothetical protein